MRLSRGGSVFPKGASGSTRAPGPGQDLLSDWAGGGDGALSARLSAEPGEKKGSLASWGASVGPGPGCHTMMTAGIIAVGGNSHMAVSSCGSRAEAGILRLLLHLDRDPRRRTLRPQGGREGSAAGARCGRGLRGHLASGVTEGPGLRWTGSGPLSWAERALVGFGMGQTDGITMPGSPSDPSGPTGGFQPQEESSQARRPHLVSPGGAWRGVESRATLEEVM